MEKSCLFRANLYYKGRVTVSLYSRMEKDRAPFSRLKAVGGPKFGYVNGCLNIRVPEELVTEEYLTHDITSVLEIKVATMSKTTLSRIEFEEITVVDSRNSRRRG